MTEKCETCRFYDKYRNSENEGLCRKNPPMPMTLVGSPDAVAMWPEVQDDDWCGEHQSKTERHPLNLVEIAVANERQRCLDIIANEDSESETDYNKVSWFAEIYSKIKSPH